MEFCGLWFVVRGGRRAQEGTRTTGTTRGIHPRAPPGHAPRR